MALELNGTTGVSLVQDGVVTAADLAAGAVGATQLASTLDLTGKTVTLPSGTGGKVLQVVNGTIFTDRVTVSSSTFVTVGSGVSITPTSATSKILVQVLYSVNIKHECSIGRGGNTNLSGVGHGVLTQTDDNWMSETFFYMDSPSSTSSQTYYLTARGYNGSTTTVNFADFSTNGPFGYMVLMEIAA